MWRNVGESGAGKEKEPFSMTSDRLCELHWINANFLPTGLHLVPLVG